MKKKDPDSAFFHGKLSTRRTHNKHAYNRINLIYFKKV